MGSRVERAELDRERAVVPNIIIEVRGGSVTNYGAGTAGNPLPMEIRERGWERVERPLDILPTPEPVQTVPTRPAHRHAQPYPSYTSPEVPDYETLDIPRRYPPYAK